MDPRPTSQRFGFSFLVCPGNWIGKKDLGGWENFFFIASRLLYFPTLLWDVPPHRDGLSSRTMPIITRTAHHGPYHFPFHVTSHHHHTHHHYCTPHSGIILEEPWISPAMKKGSQCSLGWIQVYRRYPPSRLCSFFYNNPLPLHTHLISQEIMYRRFTVGGWIYK